MKSFLLKYIFLLITISFVFSSCERDKDENENPAPDPAAGLIKIAEANLTGAAARAVFYAVDSLHTGYNEIVTVFYDSVSGKKLDDCHFHIHPSFEMNEKDYGAPVEDPEDATPPDGLFRSKVIFHKTGEWMLHMHLHNHKNNLNGEAELKINVKESNPSKVIILGDSLLIALVKPSKPSTGVNDFEMTMHRKKINAEYTAAEDYTVEIEPWMPSMQHGSANNQNPVHVSKGYYKGKVNFTMSGLWHIKLKFSKNGNVISEDKYFEVKI